MPALNASMGGLVTAIVIGSYGWISFWLFSNHHVSHALTSVMYEHYNNNNINKDKLIIVADGVGDGECLSIYKMVDNDLKQRPIITTTFPIRSNHLFCKIDDIREPFIKTKQK